MDEEERKRLTQARPPNSPTPEFLAKVRAELRRVGILPDDPARWAAFRAEAQRQIALKPPGTVKNDGRHAD